MMKIAKDRFRWKADVPLDPINVYLQSDLPNPRIYAKIDWLTVMMKDVSVDDVLDFLGLTIFQSEFAEQWFETTIVQEDAISFSYNCINIQVQKVHLYGYDLGVDLFGITFPEIRLDISGTGLDYLRTTGLNPDEYFRVQSNYPPNSHLTRFDIAFDFINYKSFILDQMIDHCLNWHTDSNRIAIYKKTSGLSFSVKLGREKTLYLGTGKKVLRVYDKRMQYCDPRTKLYTKDNPYDDPESWIRFELQLRRECAMDACFGHVGVMSLLKKIYEDYCFADVLNTNENNRVPIKFWQDLFSWDEIARIVQNFEEVQFVGLADKIISKTFDHTGFEDTILSASFIGSEHTKREAKRWLQMINHPTNEYERRRQRSFILKCEILNIDFRDPNSLLVYANPFGTSFEICFNIPGLRPIDLDSVKLEV